MGCSFDYEKTFPREFGGTRKDTYIKAFDYRADAARERFAYTGVTYSGDVGSLTDETSTRWTNFIVYEDALDYTLLWAKEVQSNTG